MPHFDIYLCNFYKLPLYLIPQSCIKASLGVFQSIRVICCPIIAVIVQCYLGPSKIGEHF